MKRRVTLLLIGIVGLLASCDRRSRVELWIIPNGYRGWLRLDYEVAGAPPLPIEGGRYVVRMPRSGRLRTSTANKPSIDRTAYDLEDESGRHALKFARGSEEYTVQDAFAAGSFPMGARGFYAWWRPHITLECVFVGTAADLKTSGKNCLAWRWGDQEPPEYRKLAVVPAGRKDR